MRGVNPIKKPVLSLVERIGVKRTISAREPLVTQIEAGECCPICAPSCTELRSVVILGLFQDRVLTATISRVSQQPNLIRKSHS